MTQHTTAIVRAVIIGLLGWSAVTIYNVDKKLQLVEYRLTVLEGKYDSRPTR